MRSPQVLTLAFVTGVLLVSCGRPAALDTRTDVGATAQHATPIALSHLEQPPVAVLPDGTRIRLELAVTPAEHERGLMFRPHLASDRGMLFLFDKPLVPDFWMKNTLIPLDMVFIGSGGAVIDVAADVRPCHAEPCPQYSPRAACTAVLEVGAGTAAAHGAVRGAHLTFIGIKALEKSD